MKEFYYFGVFLFIVWIGYCVYGFLTFVEMEIFLVLYAGVIGIIVFPFYFSILFFWNKSKKSVNVLVGLFVIVVVSVIAFSIIN
ncbi:hypothetical protein DS745_11200 [Anaerobacillus alkaliphilus]|uniref:Uncharacterized protein n=1 Tax=Anaerobacillus alkaliphilus TaxID=1548597 RepID=A0A4Q0VTY7_9BACI|nr:hypothetical protein DS745_11200 [Anaerobacillus alkaliphilus]